MYISKRLIAALALAGAMLLPASPGTAVVGQVYGAGAHTEGMTKVVHLPDGSTTVLGQLSTSFSLDGEIATCAVAEMGGSYAPLNMVMYSTSITSKTFGALPDGSATYTITGLTRSITMVGSVTVEDVVTPFEVTAIDGANANNGMPMLGDAFHMTINTSLWPHTTFGKDLTGESIPIFAGDIAIGRPIFGA